MYPTEAADRTSRCLYHVVHATLSFLLLLLLLLIIFFFSLLFLFLLLMFIPMLV